MTQRNDSLCSPLCISETKGTHNLQERTSTNMPESGQNNISVLELMSISVQIDSDTLHLTVPVAPHQSQQVYSEVTVCIKPFT